jgi:hypothetical protein
VGKSEGQTVAGRYRRRGENITIYLKETGRERVDKTNMPRDKDKLLAIVETVTNNRVP